MNEYLTVSEVARLIRMTDDYVARQCHAGALPAKKLGRAWRIPRAAVDDFMSNGQSAAPARNRKRAS